MTDPALHFTATFINKSAFITTSSYDVSLATQFHTILAPVVSDSKTKSGNGLSEIDILQQF